MTALYTKWTTFLDRQHRYPTGLAGRIIGERMVRQHTPETEWTIELLKLQPRDHVLELGFGAGRGLMLAAQQTDHGLVVGLDLSATMLQAASHRNRAALHTGRMVLLRGDAHGLPFADQHFDKIWSIHTFYFWHNPVQIFIDLIRVLNVGGTLAITLATAQMTETGEWTYWPLHQKIEALVHTLQQLHVTSAELRRGPNSRQYNNVAIVVQK